MKQVNILIFNNVFRGRYTDTCLLCFLRLTNVLHRKFVFIRLSVVSLNIRVTLLINKLKGKNIIYA